MIFKNLCSIFLSYFVLSPNSSQILTLHMLLTSSSFLSEKEKKTVSTNMESDLYWPGAADHGACPGVWLIYSIVIPCEKTYFPSPPSYFMQISSWLRGGLGASFLFVQAGILRDFSLLQVLCKHHSVSMLIGASALLCLENRLSLAMSATSALTIFLFSSA